MLSFLLYALLYYVITFALFIIINIYEEKELLVSDLIAGLLICWFAVLLYPCYKLSEWIKTLDMSYDLLNLFRKKKDK